MNHVHIVRSCISYPTNKNIFQHHRLDDAWLAKLTNRLELKRLTERNQMTEADALEMTEQAKADW